MSQSMRYAARFILIVAVIALIPALFGPKSHSGSPYVSALSNLTVSPVEAASCEKRFCSHSGNCQHTDALFNCTNIPGGTCSAVAC